MIGLADVDGFKNCIQLCVWLPTPEEEKTMRQYVCVSFLE